MYKRKYQYPIEFVTKRGTLNKNKKRKVNEWIQDMKNFTMRLNIYRKRLQIVNMLKG